MEDLKTIEEKVERVLRMLPATRNDDRLLIAKYLTIYYGVTTFADYANRKNNCTTIESIRRVRQKIQADGRCLSDTDVRAKREAYRTDYHNYALD